MTVATATPASKVLPVPASKVPLTERIAAALADGHGVGSAALKALREEADEAFIEVQSQESLARARSLDAALTANAARAARDEADDHLHEMRRLQASIAKIDETLPAVAAVERRASLMPAYLAAKREREAFVERLRDRWPKLQAEMVELLSEIRRFDETPACEIPEGCDPLRISVEALARGCDGSFHASPYQGAGVQPIPRLGASRITAFKPSSAIGQGLVWPK